MFLIVYIELLYIFEEVVTQEECFGICCPSITEANSAHFPNCNSRIFDSYFGTFLEFIRWTLLLKSAQECHKYKWECYYRYYRNVSPLKIPFNAQSKQSWLIGLFYISLSFFCSLSLSLLTWDIIFTWIDAQLST